MIAALPVDEDFIRSRVMHDPNSGCWLWERSLTTKGYGNFGVGSSKKGTARYFYAHRVAYELFKGPIPEGLEIDHKCRTRACCNPEHLEAVTSWENTLRGNNMTAVNARKTHCKRGHPFVGYNLMQRKDGRWCRTCMNDRRRKTGKRQGLKSKMEYWLQ